LGVQAVIRQGDLLRVLPLREDLRLENIVEDERVGLRGADRGPMRGRAPGQQADVRVLARFGQGIAGFEPFGFPAQGRRHTPTEVIGE